MTIFKLPDLGEGLTEAEIHEWHVKEGDIVKIDQPLVSMETAKAVVEVPSPCQGKITKLYGKVGDIINTDGPLVEFEVTEDAATPKKKNEASHDQGSVVGQMHGQVQVLAEHSNTQKTSASTSSNTLRALPAARALAQQKNIDLSKITGTGPNGLITVADVTNAKSASSTLFSDGEPLRGVRRHMVKSMTTSHEQVVDVTVVDDAYLTTWVGKNDITLRVLRALIVACQTETALNAWFDGETLQRKLHQAIHIGVAMDSDDGLFVPVLKNAEAQTPSQLRETIQRFKTQVSDRSIPQDDLQGSTIMLSNFGMFAGRYANPIIVPPNVAILGVGRMRTTPVVNADNQVVVARALPLSLTIDHRAVTGGEATRFLAAVINDLEMSA
jgi:pyruvate dehydrogenase E2 component (dihydrolipoamide acetyltransferase)